MPTIGARQAPPDFDAQMVGERFEREREAFGLSRAELAAMCDYSAEQVRKVERGERAPGAQLLAALAEAGGDIRGVLLGALRSERVSEIDAIAAAEYRDRVRREAREHSRMRADRRKKLLSDDEADLVEIYREMSREQRERFLAIASTMAAGGGVGGAVVIASGAGTKAAGRDINEAAAPTSRRKR